MAGKRKKSDTFAKSSQGSGWDDFAKEMEALQKGIHEAKEKGLSADRVNQIKDFVGKGLFVTVTGPNGSVFRVEKTKITESPRAGSPRTVTSEQMMACFQEGIAELRKYPPDTMEDGRTAAGRIAELETSLKELELLKSIGGM